MQDSIRISDKEKHNLNFLPSDPGIYRFLDNKKKVIYIGNIHNQEIEKILRRSNLMKKSLTSMQINQRKK